MRANFRLQRLHVVDGLGPDRVVQPDNAQVHYLLHVLRLREKQSILLFNGRDGEWRGEAIDIGKRSLQLICRERTRPQAPPGPVILAFAPLKTGRLDYLVQKAVEMGVGVLQPVITAHTQVQTLKADKIRAWVIEAAEQCGVLALPDIREPRSLDEFLNDVRRAPGIVFCDEGSESDAPLPVLEAMTSRPTTVLIGPEGGFSEAERVQLRAFADVTAIPLGPRILRADTAAVAALALVQSVHGDWSARTSG